MAKTPRVLTAGQSWTVHGIHQKGFDRFTSTEYAEGAGWLKTALEGGGWQVDHQAAHIAALAAYDCVLLSDIGAGAKPGSAVGAAVGADPLIVAGAFQQGRAVAFASDCGPHWAPPAFVDRPGYASFWRPMAGWAASLS